jgi:hypothetical protein
MMGIGSIIAAFVKGLVEGLVEGLVGFWKEWRARRDLQLLERTRAALEGAKKAYRASEAARRVEQDGETLTNKIDPEKPESPFIKTKDQP